MPAAYSPDTPIVDQSTGPHPSHTAKASRFDTIDSRGPIQLGATVTEAIAAVKRGEFTEEDLKQLAFAMGYQVIGGKDEPHVASVMSELRERAISAERRATMAEGAFVGKNKLTPESVTAIAGTMGLAVLPQAELDAAKSANDELTAKVSELTASLAAAQAELDAAKSTQTAQG